ncbi:GIY-YIG nuclease family protein [Candidatus Hodarchaeum mangrovi]
MSYWVYFLFVGDWKSGNNRKIYIGYTKHLIGRLSQHIGLSSIKGAKFTRKQPIELARVEIYDIQKEALQREWQLKHKSPMNQKFNKLRLINKFKEKYPSELLKINNYLKDYYEYLNLISRNLLNEEANLLATLKRN